MARSTSSTKDTARRGEAIERREACRVTMLMPGVELRPMVGSHNGARNLFTGLLSLAPEASYPFYARPFTEALILLAGEVAVDIEDRRYRLAPRDAIAVMARQPRRLVNLSADRPAELHVALASATSDQSWINGRFNPTEQAPGATGRVGSERLCRCDVVPSPELASHARFQDLYNAKLGTHGICGGHGAFEPGARLPCHRHNSDASITIVQGIATCVVEGRRHELSRCATAMVPEGLCHYFINLSLEPMAMIWVCAGDMPDRTVMDERFCNEPIVHDGSAQAQSGMKS